MKKILLLNLILLIFQNYPLTQEQRDLGFVYLHEVDPTIKVSLRYFSNENFLGKVVEGYKNPVCIVTKDAALALKNAQADFKKKGYCIVVYDSYRSQESVNNFMRWSKEINDQCKKDQYYPRVDKAKVFELGYVAERSGHSRGSTVDLTIIKDGQEVHDIKVSDRKLVDGFTVKYLDDNTEDMGTSFDLFDEASHTECKLVKRKYREKRKFLKSVMENNGFVNYDQEWWHYTLKNEPFAKDKDSSYHNFPVE